jgi:hypothetical protein
VTTRRLTPEEAAAALANAAPIPAGKGPRRLARSSIAGWSVDGEPVEIAISTSTRTLLVIVSIHCEGCRDLVGLVRDGIDGFEVVGVMRSPAGPLPDPGVSAFVGRGGTWVLGDDAFDLLDAFAAPFFCVVDAAGVVVEGVALGAEHVREHCQCVLEGSPRPDSVRLTIEPT